MVFEIRIIFIPFIRCRWLISLLLLPYCQYKITFDGIYKSNRMILCIRYTHISLWDLHIWLTLGTCGKRVVFDLENVQHMHKLNIKNFENRFDLQWNSHQMIHFNRVSIKLTPPPSSFHNWMWLSTNNFKVRSIWRHSYLFPHAFPVSC